MGCLEKDVNLNEEILRATVHAYGYDSCGMLKKNSPISLDKSKGANKWAGNMLLQLKRKIVCMQKVQN